MLELSPPPTKITFMCQTLLWAQEYAYTSHPEIKFSFLAKRQGKSLFTQIVKLTKNLTSFVIIPGTEYNSTTGSTFKFEAGAWYNVRVLASNFMGSDQFAVSDYDIEIPGLNHAMLIIAILITCF